MIGTSKALTDLSLVKNDNGDGDDGNGDSVGDGNGDSDIGDKW